MVTSQWVVCGLVGKECIHLYLVLDEKGNVIQCSRVSCTLSMPKVEVMDGMVYSLAKFKLSGNNRLYTNWNLGGYKIQIEPDTAITLVECSSYGFIRYPFNLIALECIHARSTFIVDVIGAVENVGLLFVTPMVKDILYFDLVNDEGVRIKSMVHDSLCHDLLQKY